jgi:Tat protein translocase TatB subunit
MFGIGGTELVVLIIIIAVLLGPDQIPSVVKSLSKFVREVTKAREDLKETVDSDETLRSLKQSVGEVKDELQSRVQNVTGGVQRDIEQVKEIIQKQIQEETEDHKKETKS